MKSISNPSDSVLSKRRTQSRVSSRFKANEMDNYRSHKTSKLHQQKQQQQQQQQQQQNIQQVPETILQRRERLRVYYEGRDLTPHPLVHPDYNIIEDKRTAFDVLSQINAGSRTGSSSQLPTRSSIFTPSPSFSSAYTLDDLIAVRQHGSFKNLPRESYKTFSKGFDVVEDTEDVPSQFHLPRSISEEFKSPDDKVILILSETETFFLFELQNETEDARSAEGLKVIEENERYQAVLAKSERKVLNVETQTPHRIMKTRSTYIPKNDLKNRSTIVNNWVFYDTFQNEKSVDAQSTEPKNRFKFRDSKPDAVNCNPEEQLEIIGMKDKYQELSCITLRILATNSYSDVQKRFVGLVRQDPCDPDLKLVYELDHLWCHTQDNLRRRRVSAISWNPVNDSILAAGYTSSTKSRSNKNEVTNGLVIIWCAKNPSIPDRYYEFPSCVSDIDWSKTRPNLLAVGFYDGSVKIIDVSAVQLTVIRKSSRDTLPSYEPHWQVLWWPIKSEAFDSVGDEEKLYTCNQDGRIYAFSSDVQFASREILQVWRTEGEVAGIPPYEPCLKNEVPLIRTSGVLLLRPHPSQRGIYLVATEEGLVHRCSTSHHQGYLASLRAHNGPIYDLEFSPFNDKYMLTCGADWSSRIWVEGIDQPLLTYSTSMACVSSACWSPKNSTIFISATNNEICMWDIMRKTYRPVSVTRLPEETVIQRVQFTKNGEQVVAADDDGNIYVYGTLGMPLPPFDQNQKLVSAVEKALLIKPELLDRFKKLDLLSENSQ